MVIGSIKVRCYYGLYTVELEILGVFLGGGGLKLDFNVEREYFFHF